MIEKNSKPAKLDDLAQSIGVSKVTISKALRNHPDISDSMKIKVRQLAEELGYQPNMLARNLSSRKSNIIGVVVPKIAHFFFGSVIEAVYDSVFENNYESVITVSQELVEREKKHIQSLLSMKVDGLIISITEQTKDYSIFERVQRMNIPMVFIDRVPQIPDVSSITVDDRGGAFSAIEYYINQGYRKIGLVGGYDHINIGRDRRAGFEDAMNKYNIPINLDWITEGGFGEEDGYKAFKSMISKGELPEAILAVTYPTALGFYEAASEAGIKIPENINVTCFGNSIYKFMAPSVFNYVDQPTRDLGMNAVKLLCDLMNKPQNVTSNKIELKTRLLINGRNPVKPMVVE